MSIIMFLPFWGLHIGALVFTGYLAWMFSRKFAKKISLSSASLISSLVGSILISLYVYRSTSYRLAEFAGFLDYQPVDGFFWPFIPWAFIVSWAVNAIIIFVLVRNEFDAESRKKLKKKFLVAPLVVLGVCLAFSGYVLSGLIRTTDLKERIWLFGDRYEEFVNSNSQTQRILAFNIRYQNNILAKLSKSSDEITRALVAANRITDDMTLSELSKDKSWLVRGYLMTNPTLPCDIFKKIEKVDSEHNIEKVAGISISKDENIVFKYLKVEMPVGSTYLKKYNSACTYLKSVRIQKSLYNEGMKHKDIAFTVIPAILLIAGLALLFYYTGFFEFMGKVWQANMSVPALLSFLTSLFGFGIYWLSERMMWVLFVPLYMVLLAPIIYLAVWPIYKLLYFPFDPNFNIRQRRSIAEAAVLMAYLAVSSVLFYSWHGAENTWRYLSWGGRASERLLEIYNGGKADSRLKTELARNPNMPPDILDALAETNADSVAWNINTSDETLRKLSKDEKLNQNLLENTTLPCDVLIRIVDSGKYKMLPPRLAEVLGVKISPEDRKKWPLSDRKDKRDACFIGRVAGGNVSESRNDVFESRNDTTGKG